MLLIEVQVSDCDGAGLLIARTHSGHVMTMLGFFCLPLPPSRGIRPARFARFCRPKACVPDRRPVMVRRGSALDLKVLPHLRHRDRYELRTDRLISMRRWQT